MNATVIEVLRDVADVREPREDTLLAEVMDSLELIDCVIEIENRTGRDYSDAAVEQMRTVGDLMRMIDEPTGARATSARGSTAEGGRPNGGQT